ncbi:MAG: hypothetical protein V4482_01560 [Pseudomonadota bacterium]
MMKSLLKLSATALMLSSSSIVLNASTHDEATRIEAVTKIQRFYLDNKLRHMIDSIDHENDLITFGEAEVRALNEHSDFKSILTAALFCMNESESGAAQGHGESETIAKYKAYIDREVTSTHPIRRQIAAIIKAQFVSEDSEKLNILHTLLHETLHSAYPFFRWWSYEELSGAYKDSGDKEQALSYLSQAFNLPTTYHADAYNALADFDGSEEYIAKRHFYLQRITKIGTPKQKIEALFDIADLYNNQSSAFYRPMDALNIYETLLSDATLSPEKKDSAHVELAYLLNDGPVGIKDEARAISICEEIISRKETCEVCRYASATSHLVNFYRSSNPTRALHLAQEALANQELSKLSRKRIEIALVNLYYAGPTDVQNHQEASRLLEDHVKDPINNTARLSALYQLASLLANGNAEIENTRRAIQIFEEFRGTNSCIKNNSLLQLIRLYSSDPVYKSLAGEAVCHQELLTLQANTPLEQIKSLVRLLTIYTTEGETLNPEEARATAQRLLNHPATDPTARLNMQTTLSTFYRQYPEHAIPAEIIQINEDLAHNPMANPQETYNAHNRLGAIYLAQQNLVQVVATYEHWLTRAANLERNDVVRSFINFLENKAHAAVQNPIRVTELHAILLQPLPQNTDFMTTTDVHHIPGVVAGFGGAGYIDPFFSPEMIINRKASLLALSGDLFDEINYQQNLQTTITDIKATIAEYGARDTEFSAIASVATEIFETGNSHSGSFRSICNDTESLFSYSDDGIDKTMTYGEALIRIWTRITSHELSTEIKNLFIVQLAAARDPDGHIVCHPGKFSRHCQALEGYFSDIRAATLSLRDIFTHFAQQEQTTFDALPEEDPLKALKAKIDAFNGDEAAAGESAAHDLPIPTWITQQYHAKFTALSGEEQETLNTYFEEMVTRFKQNLLRSRDVLSEAERTFARTETAGYLNLALFM